MAGSITALTRNSLSDSAFGVRVLVLGGSWFLGRGIVMEGASRGIKLTTFNRGMTATAPVPVEYVAGDWECEADVARLADSGPWDVVVDVAGAVPRVVQAYAKVLAPLTARWVFVSTISAYRDWPYAPVDEQSPLWPGDPDADPGTRAWDPDAYGPLKVGCEIAITEALGADRVSIVRPHVILGPGEYVGRLPWWLSRIARGGRVLLPGPDRSIQPIDVRDVAIFLMDLAERGNVGVYNLAAPQGRETFGGFFDSCRRTTGSDALAEWVDEQWLLERGVTEWTELPMWRALPTAWSMATQRAQSVGLRCRPLSHTVADTWAWMQAGGHAVPHERNSEHGLAPHREGQLLTAWDRLQHS